tara:strand:- start:74 stop:439 length:366 start_codon:yes stop_codon:yes gene_type:complete
MRKLADFLANDPGSPVLKHTPDGADIDSVIDLRAVFQVPHRGLERTDVHSFLTPTKGRLGLKDYEKIFCVTDDNNIYEMRGIDKLDGCIVVVRPDQYVATVLPLTGQKELAAFFSGCLTSG